jgi:hypothetical protein
VNWCVHRRSKFEIVQQTDDDWWAMIRLGSATLMLNTAYKVS